MGCEASGFLWGHSGDDGGGNAFVAYSPDGVNPNGTVGTWSESHPSKLPGEANHNAMQIHPAADSILVSLHARDSLGFIDPKNPDDASSRLVRSRGFKPHDSRIRGPRVLNGDWDLWCTTLLPTVQSFMLSIGMVRHVGACLAHRQAWIRLPTPPPSLVAT